HADHLDLDSFPTRRSSDLLKTKARARGEDVIDLGMGNPDMPTPKHIVDKLVEAAKNPKNHRYSASRGITRLRKAMSMWYRDRYADRKSTRLNSSHVSISYA